MAKKGVLSSPSTNVCVKAAVNGGGLLVSLQFSSSLCVKAAIDDGGLLVSSSLGGSGGEKSLENIDPRSRLIRFSLQTGRALENYRWAHFGGYS